MAKKGTLWGTVNLLKVVAGITSTHLTQGTRSQLDNLRAAKLVQDISISRTRQAAVATKSAIEVRRAEHKVESDVRDVEIKDLKIQKLELEILKMKKQLGIPVESAEYTPVNY